MLYLSRVSAQNVVHTEIFFDPQVHTMRNVGFEVFMPGLIQGIQVTKNKPPVLTQHFPVPPLPGLNALVTLLREVIHNLAKRCMQDGRKQYGITAGLLMCFMTELGPQGAEECLHQVPAAIKSAGAICNVDVDCDKPRVIAK